MIRAFAAIVSVELVGLSTALAQLPVLDQRCQLEPNVPHAAWFNLLPGYVWQQQVRASRPGVLDSIKLTLGGPAASTVTLRIRSGAAWSLGPVLASRTIVKSANGYETRTIDFVSAGIAMTPGNVFVLEVYGQGTDCGVVGNYINPSTNGGAALYPEPLYFLGTRFLNNGWRLGFETYVIENHPCPTDFNRDGGIDGQDVNAFLQAWEAGDSAADISNDGGLDGQDLFDFFISWEEGNC